MLYRRFLPLVFFPIGAMLVGLAALLLVPAPISSAQERVNHRFTDTACLDCHTNAAQLQELAPAADDDEAEALSSGPG